jgi:hypothetical protein
LQRTAKSCGPGAATVASIHAALWWRGNGDKNRRSPGRVRISRKPLRGESRDVLAVPVVQPVCSFATGLSHTGLRAQSAPGFPCALIKEEGQRIGKTQAKSRRENKSAFLYPRHREKRERRPFACLARGASSVSSRWSFRKHRFPEFAVPSGRARVLCIDLRPLRLNG